MDLFCSTLKAETAEMHKKNVVISFIGDIEKLSEKLQKYIELKTKLALQFPSDRDSYSAGKKDFIETMIFEAKNEVLRKREME